MTEQKMTPDELKEKVSELLAKNRRRTDGYQYTVPSPETYPYQWLWDSCFHAIALCHFAPEDAKKEIHSLLSKQFKDGMVPHLIYWDHAAQENEHIKRLNISWGTDGTSSITQPPMIAYAVWRIFERNADIKFLEETYHGLFHYYKYLLNNRDPHERELMGIISPDESGEDNSPRFDALLDLPPVHTLDENYRKRLKLVEENKECNFDAPFCMKNFFWVKDVPFNAIMVENLRCLARIAEKIGHSYDAEYFNKESAKVAAAMRAFMLEDGLYWSTFGENYTKIKVKTWGSLSPLFAGVPTQEEAAVMVKDHFANEKEFAATYGVPSVAKNEPSFDPEGFWRGPVWIAVNWFLHKGLVRYGFVKEAEHIKNVSHELIARSGFREYFNPETGEGLGAHDFTWGCLVLDMTS